MEKRPQSAFPICLWTSTSLTVKSEHLHFDTTAICRLRDGENPVPGEQSHTSTVPVGEG